MTPAGIEPATFRLVTQHLKHCATAVPHFLRYTKKSTTDIVKQTKFLNWYIFGVPDEDTDTTFVLFNDES